MTEHKYFKAVIEGIGYKINEKEYFYDQWQEVYRDVYWDARMIDVREIIFTPDFMDEYTSLRVRKHWKIEAEPCNSLLWTFYKNLMWWFDRIWNLDKPAEYLYNTLWLWIKQN